MVNAHDCIGALSNHNERTHAKRMVTGNSQLVRTAFLILYGRSIGTATNASLGNILVFVNGFLWFLFDNRQKING
jgi:hypothetical protein